MLMGPGNEPELAVVTCWVAKYVCRRHTAASLHRVLSDVLGPSAINMLYHPRDAKKNASASFAFINFASVAEAHRAVRLLHGRMWRRPDGTVDTNPRAIVLEPARVQGIAECLSTLKGDWHHQSLIIFHEGRCIDKEAALRLYCSPAEAAAAGAAANSAAPPKSPSSQRYSGVMLPAGCVWSPSLAIGLNATQPYSQLLTSDVEEEQEQEDQEARDISRGRRGGDELRGGSDASPLVQRGSGTLSQQLRSFGLPRNAQY